MLTENVDVPHLHGAFSMITPYYRTKNAHTIFYCTYADRALIDGLKGIRQESAYIINVMGFEQ